MNMTNTTTTTADDHDRWYDARYADPAADAEAAALQAAVLAGILERRNGS